MTGISLNAPNGNISIHGKNIDITADNTLTLTSGALGAAKAKVDFKDKLRDIGDTVLFDLIPAVTKAIFNRVLGPFWIWDCSVLFWKQLLSLKPVQ